MPNKNKLLPIRLGSFSVNFYTLFYSLLSLNLVSSRGTLSGIKGYNMKLFYKRCDVCGNRIPKFKIINILDCATQIKTELICDKCRSTYNMPTNIISIKNLVDIVLDEIFTTFIFGIYLIIIIDKPIFKSEVISIISCFMFAFFVVILLKFIIILMLPYKKS